MKNQLWLAATLLLTLAACGTTPNTGNSNTGNHGSGGSGSDVKLSPSDNILLTFTDRGETNHTTNAQLYLQGATKKIAVGTIKDNGTVNISISPMQVAELGLGTMSLVETFKEWKQLPETVQCDPIQKSSTNEDAKVFLFEGATIGDTNDKLVATSKNSTPPLYYQFIYADSDAKLKLNTKCATDNNNLKLDVDLDLKRGWNKISVHPIIIRKSDGSFSTIFNRKSVNENKNVNGFREYWIPSSDKLAPTAILNPPVNSVTTSYTGDLSEEKRTFKGQGVANVVKNEPLVVESRGNYYEVGKLTKITNYDKGGNDISNTSAVDFTITPEQLDQLAIKGSEITNYPIFSHYPLSKCAIPEEFKKLNQFFALTDIRYMIPGEQHPAALFADLKRTATETKGPPNSYNMFFFVDQPVEVKGERECFAEAIKTNLNYNLELKPGWNQLNVTYKINTSTLRPETDISSVGLANSFKDSWGVGQ